MATITGASMANDSRGIRASRTFTLDNTLEQKFTPDCLRSGREKYRSKRIPLLMVRADVLDHASKLAKLAAHLRKTGDRSSPVLPDILVMA